MDSPRVHGEQVGHTRMLAAVDSPLPPIVVHRSTMRVIDGWHRLRAALLRGDEAIEVRYFTGPAADAFVLAVKLNHAHGLPLSTADRKFAATRIVESHPAWSDRRISAVTGLAAGTIAAIRECSTGQIGQSNVRVGLDGRTRPVDSADARRRAAKLIAANPAASLREIAKAARISPSTVMDVRARLARGEAPLTPAQRRLRGAERPTGHASTPSAGPDRLVEPSTARPGTEDDDGRGERAHRFVPLGRAEASPGEFVALLARDPSLRGTEAGRVLLRLISCVAVEADQWDEMVRRVPVHQRDVVVKLARECATVWRGFANRLEGQAAGT
ncbi:ParB-like nuclease domain-containing protein [Amycolatopsis sp. H6(2020)]|nr:ParB-like nuclease domain-containing protein [Amycolatopsis sp. H6(2020)]